MGWPAQSGQDVIPDEREADEKDPLRADLRVGYTVAETTDWSAAAVAGRGASPAPAPATNPNRRPGKIPERRWYDLVC